MNAVSQQYRRSKIHPYQFALWVGLATIIMMFVAFTSAYIVRRAAGNWYEFRLPDIFMVSTVVILLSSVTFQLSFNFFKKGWEAGYKGFMIATFLLGIAFIVLQYQGWRAMDAQGATLTVNPSSSFIYLISGVHVAHVLGGITILMVALTHAFVLPYKPTERRRMRFSLSLQYWHFVDILWVYLFAFFMLQS
ncbi:MAG: cytochrome c oxidase subunit 3 [Saprospiraceae bacterium]